MSTFAAGVIGLGVGQMHAQFYAQDERTRLVALCDTDPAKRDWARQAYPGVTVYDDYRALLDQPELDVVSIASPDDDHAAQIIAALNRDCHVFAEKPLCTLREDTAAVQALLAQKPHLRLSTNTVLRRSPRFMKLKSDIDAGLYGTVFSIEADYAYGRLWKITSGWRHDMPHYSVMAGGGIHMIDLVLWLTGEPIVSVQALSSDLGAQGTGFSGHDLTIALCRLGSGAIAKISANYACVQPHFHRLLVYGTKRTFENRMGPAMVYAGRDDTRTIEDDDSPYPAVAKFALMPSFIDAISGSGPPDVCEQDVFRAMRVCHAIDESAKDGGRVIDLA